MLKSYKVVIFSAHPLKTTPYGLHHIARALCLLGCDVLFVDPPFSPVHILTKKRRGRKMGAVKLVRNIASVDNVTTIGKLHSYSPFCILPYANFPLSRSLLLVDNWDRTTIEKPQDAIIKAGFKNPDLIINGSPIFHKISMWLDAKCKVYRYADDARLFTHIPNNISALELERLCNYDQVWVTNTVLQDYINHYNPRKTIIVTNGVDPSFFKPSKEKPPIIKNPQKTVIYAGAMESWFDWDLLKKAANMRPDIDFILLGRYRKQQLPINIKCVGQVPYNNLRHYFRHSAIGIVPFIRKSIGVEAINPLKVYEYLAAGLPVITYSTPYGLSSEYVHDYKNLNEFLKYIDIYTTKKKQDNTISVPKEFTWLNIVKNNIFKNHLESESKWG